MRGADWFCASRKLNSPIDGRFVIVCDSICVGVGVGVGVLEAGGAAVALDNAGAAGLRNEDWGTVGSADCEGLADVVDAKLKLRGLLACVAAG